MFLNLEYHCASKLWPGAAPEFALKRDDGRAEAALIAAAGVKRSAA